MAKLQALLFSTMFLFAVSCTTANIESAKIADMIELAKASNPNPTAVQSFRDCIGDQTSNALLVKQCAELATRDIERAEETAKARAQQPVVVVAPQDPIYDGGTVAYTTSTCPPNAFGCTSGALQVVTRSANTRPAGGYAPATSNGSRKH